MHNYVTWLLENKLNRMIEMSKVAKKDIVRANKSGMFKPYAHWKAGFDKGTDMITRKAGYSMHKILKNPVNSSVSPTHKMIFVSDPAYVKPRERGSVSLINRHEADEAHFTNKRTKGKDLEHLIGMAADAKPNIKFFSHESPRVLQNERKYSNFARSVYGQKSGGAVQHKMRHFIKDEYRTLDNKKALKNFDKKNAERTTTAIKIGENRKNDLNTRLSTNMAIKRTKEKYVSKATEHGTVRDMIKELQREHGWNKRISKIKNTFGLLKKMPPEQVQLYKHSRRAENHVMKSAKKLKTEINKFKGEK